MQPFIDTRDKREVVKKIFEECESIYQYEREKIRRKKLRKQLNEYREHRHLTTGKTNLRLKLIDKFYK